MNPGLAVQCSVSIFWQFYEWIKLFLVGNVWRHLDRCNHTCGSKSYECCMWACVAQTWPQSFCTLNYAHCWFLHTHVVIVLTYLWNSTGALLTPPLLSSLPPHLLLCSSHSFLPPPLREEKICHSLSSYCRMMDDEDYPLAVTEKGTLCWPWPWSLWRKKGTKDGN